MFYLLLLLLRKKAGQFALTAVLSASSVAHPDDWIVVLGAVGVFVDGPCEAGPSEGVSLKMIIINPFQL